MVLEQLVGHLWGNLSVAISFHNKLTVCLTAIEPATRKLRAVVQRATIPYSLQAEIPMNRCGFVG